MNSRPPTDVRCDESRVNLHSSRTIDDVDTLVAATLGGVTGLGIGIVALLTFQLSERAMKKGVEQPEPHVSPDVMRVLSVLRSSALVIDSQNAVLQASPVARAFRLVEHARVADTRLAELVQKVRSDGEIRQLEMELSREADNPTHAETATMVARVAPIGQHMILVLLEDRTKERRLDAIRRDFVANVSHELKTPVGALTVLSEAVQHAADDPEAVARFAGRMQIESDRLTRLVQQIIELSRVQYDDLLEEAVQVNLDRVVEAALDRCRVDAQTKGVSMKRSGETGFEIIGSEQQLVIALGNLIQNAINYSRPDGRVVVDVRRTGDQGEFAQIAVADQGVGIPESEQERVFERFYRVDRARSRETGGTGLGLSIVKHVAAGHGGDVDVWSVAGEGSTFTLRLPLPGASASAVRPGSTMTSLAT